MLPVPESKRGAGYRGSLSLERELAVGSLSPGEGIGTLGPIVLSGSWKPA